MNKGYKIKRKWFVLLGCACGLGFSIVIMFIVWLGGFDWKLERNYHNAFALGYTILFTLGGGWIAGPTWDLKKYE